MEIKLANWKDQPRKAVVSWLWDDEFFFETEKGNFVWKCSKYGGDNSFRGLPHSLEEYMVVKGVKFVYTYPDQFVTSSFIINLFTQNNYHHNNSINYIDTSHLYK